MLRWRTMLAWPFSRAPLGARGERLAGRHLQRQGYRVLARNLRNRLGEVDLVAEAPDRKTIVIVEVKSTSADARDLQNPTPEVHVNRAKQRKLTALACQLCRQYGWSDRPIRFDVIGVEVPGPRSGGEPVIRHHMAAFESQV